MEAVTMYRRMLCKYVDSLQDYREKASKLYCEHSMAYHRFVTARDFHVRLGGSTQFIVGSPISEMERVLYFEQKSKASEFVLFCLENFREENVVQCLPVEMEHITIERIRNEFLTEIHPDLTNFVNFEERNNGVISLNFAEIFETRNEKQRAIMKIQRLCFRYYPLFAIEPSWSRGFFGGFSCVGQLGGECVYSEAEYLSDIWYVISKGLALPIELRDIVLSYAVVSGEYRRTISGRQRCARPRRG
jgi:hypothetical protein